MAVETIKEKIKIGQLLDKNNKPIEISSNFVFYFVVTEAKKKMFY